MSGPHIPAPPGKPIPPFLNAGKRSATFSPVVPVRHHGDNRVRDLPAGLPSMRTTEEIADSPYVSVDTVKTRLRGVCRELGVSRRRDAVLVVSQRSTWARLAPWATT